MLGFFVFKGVINTMDESRWLNLMAAWGFEQNLQVFSELDKAYSQSGRFYHNAQHVDACLVHFDNIKANLTYPREVELALWFHDAIYKIFSSNNEKNSAIWARDFLLDNGAALDAASRAYDLILATRHNAPAATLDASFLVDIDLSILGATLRVYAQFEQDIRREYRMVPSAIYRKKRIAVLQGFLRRETIFNNAPFSSQLEAQARDNIKAAITNLMAC